MPSSCRVPGLMQWGEAPCVPPRAGDVRGRESSTIQGLAYAGGCPRQPAHLLAPGIIHSLRSRVEAARRAANSAEPTSGGLSEREDLTPEEPFATSLARRIFPGRGSNDRVIAQAKP